MDGDAPTVSCRLRAGDNQTMDTKRLITGVLIVFALILGWQAFLGYLAKKNNWAIGPTTHPAATQEAATQPTTQRTAASPATHPATEPSMAAIPPKTAPASTGPFAVVPTPGTKGAQVITLGHPQLDVKEQAEYPLALSIDPQGAGLDSVILNRFRNTSGSPDPYIYEQPKDIDPGKTRPLATRSITIDGRQTLDLLDQLWTLKSHDQSSAVYTLTIASDTGDLTLQKTYRLTPKTDAGRGYVVSVDYTLTNHTSKPLTVATTFNGPTAPPYDPMQRDDRQIIAGYWDQGIVKVDSDMVYNFSDKMKFKDLSKNKDGQPVLWVGASSVYFDAIVRPIPLEGHLAAYLKAVQADALNPDAPSEQRQAALTLSTGELTIAAGKQLTLPMEMFVGPKKRSLLNSAYYAAAPRGYDGTIGTMTSWCAFSWLINGLVYLLIAFHWVLRDWGLAIIALVVLVRIILHPITKRSTISMQKMTKMGPEMERIKKKYADNKDELNKAMMQVYKQQGVAPILGCLPMFLQMPIWIALWDMLRSTFELRQAPFLWGWTWIKDLTQPDHLFTFAHPVHIFFFTIAGLNVLPILLAFAYYFQQKYTPKPPAATPEQEKQQKMMQWMSLLFPIFLYAEPSGLNLYIAASTGVGIWEQKRIRDHIRRQDELEKNQRVIVDAKPTRAKRLSRNGEQDQARPKGAFARWIADLQQRAEQVKREAERKK